MRIDLVVKFAYVKSPTPSITHRTSHVAVHLGEYWMLKARPDALKYHQSRDLVRHGFSDIDKSHYMTRLESDDYFVSS